MRYPYCVSGFIGYLIFLMPIYALPARQELPITSVKTKANMPENVNFKSFGNKLMTLDC